MLLNCTFVLFSLFQLHLGSLPKIKTPPKRVVFLLAISSQFFVGLERRLLATCRWRVATAVAFPQKSESNKGSQNKGQVTRPAFCFGFFVWFYSIAPSPSMRGLWAESLAASLVSLANVVVRFKPGNYVLFSSRCFKHAGLVTFQNTTVSSKINIEYYVYTTYDM